MITLQSSPREGNNNPKSKSKSNKKLCSNKSFNKKTKKLLKNTSKVNKKQFLKQSQKANSYQPINSLKE